MLLPELHFFYVGWVYVDYLQDKQEFNMIKSKLCPYGNLKKKKHYDGALLFYIFKETKKLRKRSYDIGQPNRA